MNKHIKNKKKWKLEVKKIISKEGRIFIKKYPRLYAICIMNDISIREINKAWNKVKKIDWITKESFENMVRSVIVAKEEKWVFSEGSRGEFNIKLFEKLGIKFK